MGKKSKRLSKRREKDQAGCMRGLINMFDFHHGNGRSPKKLLSDRRCGNGDLSKHSSSTGDKLEKATSLDENFQEAIDDEEKSSVSVVHKASVKKLIEEEMFSEQEGLRKVNNKEKQIDFEHDGFKKKNCKRKNKNRAKSCGNISEIGSEANQSSRHYSANDLAIDNLIEEVLNKIHQKTAVEADSQLNCNSNEKLSELIKFLVSQKLIQDNNHLTEDSDLREAIQILGADEELFMKILQDPDILIPKGVQSFRIEKQEDIRSNHKNRGFFRRRSKNENSSSPDLNRIVILKPGPETGFSSPGPSCVERNTGQNDRNSSRFFLDEIKRKLKYVMGNNERVAKENHGIRSPTKDHFFTERMTKPSSGAKKVDKAKDFEIRTEHETRVSNIYIEAKKHLSEMLSNGDVDVNISSKKLPNTLGRVLSLPEYSSSPLGSPGKTPLQTTEKTETKPSASDEISDNTAEPDNNDNEVDEISFIKDGENLEGDTETAKSIDIAVQEESCSSVTNDISEMCIENRDSEISVEDSLEEIPHLTTQIESPPNSSTRKVDYHESATDTQEWSSPISVLEPFYTEDDISPASSKSRSVEIQIQPRKMQFEEHEQDMHFKTSTDKESIFEYVKAVVSASGLDWEELYMKSLSSDQVLDPSLIEDINFLTNQLCSEPKLLFDCIDEVLMVTLSCPPWISFVRPKIKPFHDLNNAIQEVSEHVYWHLTPLPLPLTLDHIVKKDMTKTGAWMDLRFENETIVIETGEAILEDLLQEIVVNCEIQSLDSGFKL